MPKPPQYVERIEFESPRVQNRMVRFLGGLKFGLTLLVLIIIASSIGEVLPADPENNLAFELVFKSWWYRLLLFLLAINLVLNTYMTYVEDTYPQFLPIYRDRADNFKPLKIRQTLSFKETAAESPKQLMESLAHALSGRGYKTFFNGDSLYGHRGLVARFGSSVTHLGLIILLFGALAVSFLKVEGYVDMVEGETISTYRLVDEPQTEANRHELGFEVTCLDFDFRQYPGTQTASKFKSTVLFQKPGEPPVGDFVRVNHKVSFGGWVFHQNSFAGPDLAPGLEQFNRFYVELVHDSGGEVPIEYAFETFLTPGEAEITPLAGHDDLFFAVEADPTGRNAIWTVATKDKIVARGTESLFGDLSMELVRFFPHLQLDENNRALNLSTEPLNPAALIVISAGNRVIFRDWVLYNDREQAAAEGSPIEVVMTDFELPTQIASDSAAASTLLGGSLTAAPSNPPAQAADLASIEENAVVTVAFRGESGGIAGDRTFRLRRGQAVPLVSEEGQAFQIPGPFTVETFRRIPTYITTLSISKNPGVSLVWLGSILASFGPVLAFFVSRRRVWVHVDWDKQKLMVGGDSRYSRDALEDEISEILAEWSRRDDVGLKPPVQAGPPKHTEVLDTHI